MSDSFLDEFQVEEMDKTGFHALSDEEIEEVYEDADMNVVHQFNTREIHTTFWSDFSQVNEDDIPF